MAGRSPSEAWNHPQGRRARGHLAPIAEQQNRWPLDPDRVHLAAHLRRRLDEFPTTRID